MKKAYSHYYKTLPCLTVDVYRVLHAFEVTDPCLQHAAKKIMCAGGRGAKDAKKDVEEAIDSLVRWLEMRREESGENMQGNDLKVSICDTMNLADSFLNDAAKGLVSWGAEMGMKWKECDSLTPVSVRTQYSLDGVTWNDSKDGSYNVGNATAFQARIHPDDDLRWNEHHEARIDAIGQNGPTGEHYLYETSIEMMREQDKAGIYAAPKQDNGWIEWSGRERPVPWRCGVDIRFACGEERKNVTAGCFNWDVLNSGEPIAAYRICNEIYNDDEEAQA